MTLKEFNDQFLPRLYAMLPGQRKWVFENSSDPSLTHGMWFKVLEPYSLDDCNNVMEEIQFGKIRIEAYERDNIAILIRDHISLIEKDNENSSSRKLYASPTCSYEGSDIGKVFVEMASLERDKPRGWEQQIQLLMESVDVDKAAVCHQTCRCTLCMDTGYVQCIHPSEFTNVLNGKLISENFDLCMFLCGCETGQKIERLHQRLIGSKKPILPLKYDSDRCVLATNFKLTKKEQYQLSKMIKSRNCPVEEFAAFS